MTHNLSLRLDAIGEYDKALITAGDAAVRFRALAATDASAWAREAVDLCAALQGDGVDAVAAASRSG